MAVALVDARNAIRSRWPNIPAEEFVERAARWAEREGLRATLVFDGRAPGGVVGEHEVAPGVLVVGTGAESADEWIERAATSLAATGETYWLVTSDRALRDAAGPAASRVIGGGTYAGEVLAT